VSALSLRGVCMRVTGGHAGPPLQYPLVSVGADLCVRPVRHHSQRIHHNSFCSNHCSNESLPKRSGCSRSSDLERIVPNIIPRSLQRYFISNNVIKVIALPEPLGKGWPTWLVYAANVFIRGHSLEPLNNSSKGWMLWYKAVGIGCSSRKGRTVILVCTF